MNQHLSEKQQERLEAVDEGKLNTPDQSTSFVEQMEALNLSSISVAHSMISQERTEYQKTQHVEEKKEPIIHKDDSSSDSLDRKNGRTTPEQTPEPVIKANAIPPSPIITTRTSMPSSSSSVPPFVMGDHVYRRFTYAMIPFQHHAIVLDVWKEDPEEEEEEEGDDCVWILKIFDFSRHPEDGEAMPPDSPRVVLSSSKAPRNGGLRVYESPAHHWQKVIYGAPWMQRHLWSSSGTCTAATSDAPGLVRARVQFLLEHATKEEEAGTNNKEPNTRLLPSYAWLYANSECVAVWCKTGTWATMQAVSWLTWTALGQVKSAATMAGVAAATQVAVPAAGLWGWFGYTTQVSLLTVQPALLPAIAAYGAVTVALPAAWWHRSRHQWQSTTIRLNEAFWNAAVEDPESFVDGITHWSE